MMRNTIKKETEIFRFLDFKKKEMETFKSSNESENSHLVDDLRSGMEEMVNNPLLAEAYDMSKAYLDCIRQKHNIFPGQSCATERTFSFDKNVTYFHNSKSKDFSMFMAEFESIRTRVLKTNLKIDDRNRISSLQDKIVSSSVEKVPVIESYNSRKRVPSSKDRPSVRDRIRLLERQKNISIQKGAHPSCTKKVNFSHLSLLASKAEMKALPSNQYNFQLGKTGILVDEIPSAKRSFAYNIHPSTPSKKRRYKVKVKVQVRRKKLKCEPSLPPPPPSAKGSLAYNTHPSTSSKKRKYKVKDRRKKQNREASPPPPPPPSAKGSLAYNTHPSTSSKKRKHKVKDRRKKLKREASPPPPPPPPKLPSPSPFPILPLRSQAEFSLSSYPRPLLPPPPIKLPIPGLSFRPRPLIPYDPLGNSKSRRSVNPFPLYSPEILTMISSHQVHQGLQTSHCNVNWLHYLQATGQNIPGAIQDNYSTFYITPHASLFHANYPSNFNTHMCTSQQYPVMLYRNQQPN
ncbi:unnamed protein product [Larinioides sclopetarius]|uniref:Uncharacterized protein n=1 Tax=Larinioides sclopetarius TaxID=280406 RepID=A0AAV2BQU1_9ARAC